MSYVKRKRENQQELQINDCPFHRSSRADAGQTAHAFSVQKGFCFLLLKQKKLDKYKTKYSP